MGEKPSDLNYGRQSHRRSFDPISFAWAVAFLTLSIAAFLSGILLTIAALQGRWLAWFGLLIALPIAVLAGDGVAHPLRKKRWILNRFKKQR